MSAIGLLGGWNRADRTGDDSIGSHGAPHALVVNATDNASGDGVGGNGGDANGGADLLPYAFPVGLHTLTVTAFSASDAGGSVLSQLTVTFTVV